jgi:hypothetical protein
METNTKDSIRMVSSTEKESIPGPMDRVTKVSLSKGFGKVKAAGNRQKIMEISILEHTKLIKRMDMADMFGRMDAYSREALRTMSSTFIFIQARKRQTYISRWQGS